MSFSTDDYEAGNNVATIAGWLRFNPLKYELPIEIDENNIAGDLDKGAYARNFFSWFIFPRYSGFNFGKSLIYFVIIYFFDKVAEFIKNNYFTSFQRRRNLFRVYKIASVVLCIVSLVFVKQGFQLTKNGISEVIELSDELG